MKRFVSFLLCVLLILSFSASVYAVESKARLSDMSESECLEYIRQSGVMIPDDNANGTTWAGFVKYTIQQVEADPYCVFSYNYSLSNHFAEEIRTVVNNYYGISAVYNIASDSLQRVNTRHALQYSSSLGSWKSEYYNYRCYSYSIGITMNENDPGKIAGITAGNEDILALSFTEQIRRIKADLTALGHHCISDTATCPGYYLKNEGFSVIAYRVTANNASQKDYHFMRMDDDYWSHKPAVSQPLRYNYLPYLGTWNNERMVNGLVYEATITYTSEIRYIKYSIPELYYMSNNRHRKYCPGCESYIGTEDCTLEYVYCGSLDIGDFHHISCVRCGHVADTDVIACRFQWTYYGSYNGRVCHVKRCIDCKQQSGVPQPCVYSTPGMCDYCG